MYKKLLILSLAITCIVGQTKFQKLPNNLYINGWNVLSDTSTNTAGLVSTASTQKYTAYNFAKNFAKTCSTADEPKYNAGNEAAFDGVTNTNVADVHNCKTNLDNILGAKPLDNIPVNTLRCYTALSEHEHKGETNVAKWLGCFKDALGDLTTSWVWFQKAFMFGITEWKFFAEADSTTNSFKAGTIGGFQSCVNRNSCHDNLSDRLGNGDNDAAATDPWYWTYHANIITALGAGDCTALKDSFSGKEPSTTYDSAAFIKCYDSVRQMAVWTDRLALNCYTQCAENTAAAPLLDGSVGAVDGEADDSEKEYQTEKKAAIEALIKCVNDSKVPYQYEEHPVDAVVPSTHDTALYPTTYKTTPIGEFGTLAADYEQIRTCLNHSNECKAFRNFIKHQYQHKDSYETEIKDCLEKCGIKDYTWSNLIEETNPANPSMSSDTSFQHIQSLHLTQKERVTTKTHMCYNKFARRWHINEHKYYQNSNASLLQMALGLAAIIISLII